MLEMLVSRLPNNQLSELINNDPQNLAWKIFESPVSKEKLIKAVITKFGINLIVKKKLREMLIQLMRPDEVIQLVSAYQNINESEDFWELARKYTQDDLAPLARMLEIEKELKSTQLFVSDLPLAPPNEYSDQYKLNPILDFALVEANSHTFEKAQTYFKNSKAYRWLKNQIQENKEHRDLGFGAVSKLLHNALCDDPAPYRKEIKTLQANLYLYLKKYADDEIEIYMPGARREVLRLLRKKHAST